jgi:cell division inhibitor SepF
MRKMGVYLGLVEDDDWDADGYVTERSGRHGDSADAGAAVRGSSYGETRYSREHYPRHHQDAPRAGRARDYADYGDYAGEIEASESIRPGAGEDFPAYQITTLHPRTYNEARTIGEHFRKSTPVIMNLSEMDDADAKRLVDFAAGLTFGLHGRIERVTAKVFLLSPHNVTVTAQDKARIAETGFFNQS